MEIHVLGCRADILGAMAICRGASLCDEFLQTTDVNVIGSASLKTPTTTPSKCNMSLILDLSRPLSCHYSLHPECLLLGIPHVRLLRHSQLDFTLTAAGFLTPR